MDIDCLVREEVGEEVVDRLGRWLIEDRRHAVTARESPRVLDTRAMLPCPCMLVDLRCFGGGGAKSASRVGVEDKRGLPNPNASPVPSAAVNIPAWIKLEVLSPCPISDIVDENRLAGTVG